MSMTNVTDIGHSYLESYIGQDNGKEHFMNKKVDGWIWDVEDSAQIAVLESQLAYSAYIYGHDQKKVLWNTKNLFRRMWQYSQNRL